MDDNFECQYVSTLDRVGVSAERPVRVGSWIAGSGSWRSLLPNHADYPGWHYGSPVYVPESQQDHLPHSHEHFEISIIREGRALHRTAYAMEELNAGSVIVLTPGMTHAIYGLEGLHQTNLYYLTEWLADDLMDYWRESGLVPLFLAAALFRRPKDGPITRFTLSREELADLDREFADIGRETVLAKPSLTFLRSTLLKALILLSRSSHRQSAAEISMGFRDEIVTVLEHVEDTILRCDPFNVSHLAEELGFCSDHLSTLFREATGYSPMGYYQRRRVHHACNQLLDLNQSVTEIAHNLGFCDSAHFTKMFKKYQGIAPIEYRHRYTKAR